MVFIDANTGKPVNRYSMIDNALDRELYEASDDRRRRRPRTVWKEGDPFPGDLNAGPAEPGRTPPGESYWFFKNAFGRDSYDGNGAKRITVNNDPTIACPNANWNGVTTNYCDGVTSDDVVAHEWGHAYTEYTNGLIYQWQPGALNESYSDIWGETLDLINDREDEGEGDLDAKRPDGVCALDTPRRGSSSSITARPAIGRSAPPSPADFGPTITATGITDDVVVAIDAADPTGPSTTDGCTAFTNAAAVAGNFASSTAARCALHGQGRQRRERGRDRHRHRQQRRRPRRLVGRRRGHRSHGAHGHPGRRHRDQGRAAPGTVTATMRPTDTTRDGGLLPLADRREVRRPSVARSATCGTRPATATRAR